MTQDFLQKMQQRYEELTGIPADEASDIGIRLRILAEQLELLYQQLEEEKNQAFVARSHPGLVDLFLRETRRAKEANLEKNTPALAKFKREKER